MTNTIRWFQKSHIRSKLRFDEGCKDAHCKYYGTSWCDKCVYGQPPEPWNEDNPLSGEKEHKKFRVEQSKKVRHQNKILLRKGWEPDKRIEHTRGWGSN